MRLLCLAQSSVIPFRTSGVVKELFCIAISFFESSLSAVLGRASEGRPGDDYDLPELWCSKQISGGEEQCQYEILQGSSQSLWRSC